jgi:hypothetical protein
MDKVVVVRLLSIVPLVSGLSGCLWERLQDRPARLQLGAAVRQERVATSATGGVAARTITPGGSVGAVDTTAATGATTGVLQFTMSAPYGAYLGGELESGTLGGPGSQLGGAYGVLGTEHGSSLGALSLEVALGPQWRRAGQDAADVTRFAVEPRARAQLWLTPQVTLGGVLGTSGPLGDGGYMAGVYLGVYGTAYNGPATLASDRATGPRRFHRRHRTY